MIRIMPWEIAMDSNGETRKVHGHSRPGKRLREATEGKPHTKKLSVLLWVVRTMGKFSFLFFFSFPFLCFSESSEFSIISVYCFWNHQKRESP